MKNIKISVVTVVYNGAEFIENCIKSVLGQNYPELEYIIIDGGSTDGTVDIIKKYSDKISYWISEPDGGIYNAMNKGIDKATGEIVGLINSDDWYLPDTLKDVSEMYLRNDKPDVVHGGLKMVSKKRTYSINYSAKHLKEWLSTGHISCFIKNEIYQEKKYREDLRIASDYDFILSLYLDNKKFVRMERDVACFQEGGTSSDLIKQDEEVYSIHAKYLGVAHAKKVLREKKRHRILKNFVSWVLPEPLLELIRKIYQKNKDNHQT